jgi:hypothetical protein
MRIRDPKTTALIFASGKMARAPRCRRERWAPILGLRTRGLRHRSADTRCAASPPRLRALRVTRALRVSDRAERAAAPQVVTGAKTEAMAKYAARKYARIIQKLGFPAQFRVRGAAAAPQGAARRADAAAARAGLHHPKHRRLLRRALPHPAGRAVLRAPAVLERASPPRQALAPGRSR